MSKWIYRRIDRYAARHLDNGYRVIWKFMIKSQKIHNKHKAKIVSYWYNKDESVH